MTDKEIYELVRKTYTDVNKNYITEQLRMLANSVRTIPITVAQASVVVFWVVLSFIKGTFNAVKIL